MSTSRTWIARVRSATNRGSSDSAPSRFVAVTFHHSSCPPARQVDGTRPCLKGLSKPCQAANAAAHSCDSWRWWRTNNFMDRWSSETPGGTSVGHPERAPLERPAPAEWRALGKCGSVRISGGDWHHLRLVGDLRQELEPLRQPPVP